MNAELLPIKNPFTNEDELSTAIFLFLASPTQILENVFSMLETLQQRPAASSDGLKELAEGLRLKLAVFAHKAGIRNNRTVMSPVMETTCQR